MAGSSLYNKYFKNRSNGSQNNQTQNQQYGQNNVIQNIMDGFNQIKTNQTNIADMLFQNGKINQQQYGAIKGMGNDYRGIAQYLMQSGLMPQSINQMNPFVGQIMKMLGR